LGSLESGRGMLILVGTILILLLVSLLLNALLWVSWRREKNRPTQDIARIRAHTKQKLTELKRDIGRQAKLLSKVRGRKSLTPEDADYVKKMQADLTDAEQYIDGKIKDIG